MIRRLRSSATPVGIATVLLLLPVAVQPALADAGGWLAPELAEKLRQEPAGEVDRDIRAAIETYREKIDALDATDPLVSAWLPRAKNNIEALCREYNARKNRYRKDHFTARECLQFFHGEMSWLIDEGLAKGQDPSRTARGRWRGMCLWYEPLGILGRYDVILPANYDPSRAHPVIFSYQSEPDMNRIRQTEYLLVRCVQKGYPKGLAALEVKTREILKDVAKNFHIDPHRIYGTGFSYGGHTDLVMAWRYPHWFAAIAPVCNDLRDQTTPYVKYLKNVPTFLLHGTGDSFLNTGKTVYQYMTEAGCPVWWDTYPGGHDANVPFREKPEMLTDFFTKHTMTPYPKMVEHIVEHKRYSRAFWVNARLVRDASGMQAVFHVEIQEPNRIEIEANDQIAALTLDLQKELVDMSRPVTVVAGEKVLYEGPAKESLTVKLNEGEDYTVLPGDTLWKDLAAIIETAPYRKTSGLTQSK